MTEDIGDYTFSEPFISVGISDIRGIKNNLVLEQGEDRRWRMAGCWVSTWPCCRQCPAWWRC